MQVPLAQWLELQSPLAPHGLPLPHAGAHAGVAHVPLVHTPEPQSWLSTHGNPSAQGGEHCFVPGHTAVPQSVQGALPHSYTV
jgi:hypothetical protein